jgi:uncharacterized membrane protein
MTFVFVALIFLVFDMIWIYTMTPILYRGIFENIQKSHLNFDMKYAVCAYIVLIGVLYFVCRPLSETRMYNNRPWLAYGLVGFSVYAVYNLTNASVFSSYPLHMIIIDSLWGLFAFSVIGAIDSYIKYLRK